jgi:protein TonB
VAGGVIGGVVGGTGSIPFGEGMTRPKLISGGNGRDRPEYTREASLAGIEGMMVVKCVITTEGRVQHCQVIKPLAHMDQAVLEWLAGSTYSPVTFQGRPTQVSYVFNFSFKLPK